MPMRAVLRPRESSLAGRAQAVVIALSLAFLFVELRVHRHLYPSRGHPYTPPPLPPVPRLVVRVEEEAPPRPVVVATTTTAAVATTPPPTKNEDEERGRVAAAAAAAAEAQERVAEAWLDTCQRGRADLEAALTQCMQEPCLSPADVAWADNKPAKLRVELVHPLIQTCLRIQKTMPPGVVYLQYLDKSFVEMTKNWICNVLGLRTVLPRNVFIVTDREAEAQLVEFSKQVVEPTGAPPLNVVLVEYVPKGGSGGNGLSYGTLPYYDLMLFRTGINYQLLAHGIDIFIIESDAVWHLDPSEMMFAQPGDVVTSNDMSEGQPPGISHGFSLWRPKNPRVLEFVGALLAHQEANLGADGDAGNEQFQMMRQFRGEFRDLVLTFLPNHLFTNGLRFTENIPEHRMPYVRQNNYVVGNGVKTSRAKSAGWWYLSGDGRKCDRTVQQKK